MSGHPRSRRLLLFAGGVLAVCGLLGGIRNLAAGIQPRDVGSCTADSECVLVSAGFCGGTTAIHSRFTSLWQAHLFLGRPILPFFTCPVSLPREQYEAACLNRSCRALFRPADAVLYFLEPPRLGEPATLVFKYAYDTGGRPAAMLVDLEPEGDLALPRPQEWQQIPEPGEWQLKEFPLTFTRPGYYRLSAQLRMSETEPAPLNAELYFLLNEYGEVLYGEKVSNGWKNERLAYQAERDHPRIDALLTIQPPPAVGQEAVIRYTVSYSPELADVDEVGLSLAIPSGGLEVLDYDFPEGQAGSYTPGESALLPGGIQTAMAAVLSWRGRLNGREALEIVVRVRARSPGWGILVGQADFTGLTLSEADTVWLTLHTDPYTGWVETR